MEELTARFVKEAQERSAAVAELLAGLSASSAAADDCDAIRDHAHKLKGAAGMFGFVDLRAVAAELEEAAAGQVENGADGAAELLAPLVGRLAEATPQ